MNIIYIFHSLTVVGGLEKIFIDKMNYLSEISNYNITIITHEQGNYPVIFPLSPKVNHIDIDIPFYYQYQYNLLKRFFYVLKMKKRYLKRLQEQVDILKPDIIITTTYSYYDIDTIMKLNDPSKKIIETHTAKESIGEYFLFRKRCFLRRWIAKVSDKHLYRLIKKSSILITLTAKDAEAWKDIKEATVIPNLLGYYPPTLKKYVNKKQVITAGRLTEQKGYDLLIDAWILIHLQHPDWSLQIYGSGEDEEKLLSKIRKHKLTDTIQINSPTDQIYDKYMESDIYVMSSRWEGFGLVLIEAMSCGIPCISFDCPHGPSDIIKDKVDGLLVENSNVQQLAEKICFLIENEDIRLKMGENARENVKRYLSGNIISQWKSLFSTLIDKK